MEEVYAERDSRKRNVCPLPLPLRTGDTRPSLVVGSAPTASTNSSASGGAGGGDLEGRRSVLNLGDGERVSLDICMVAVMEVDRMRRSLGRDRRVDRDTM